MIADARISPVSVPVGEVAVEGDVALVPEPSAVVIFAHGSGSSRHSVRNQAVARVLQNAGIATLMMDLLTPEEERIDLVTA
jgi:methylmalonyl-CoA mutase cobalamin-binding subunit